MKAEPVILIFDIGKTNKKILIFDQTYKTVYSASEQFEEVKDEDGFPCEDIHMLTRWVQSSVSWILSDPRYDVRAINFSTYGASLVYVNEKLQPVLPLYNYLKPYPTLLQDTFYARYGGPSEFSTTTASPILGSLNSGMQLLRVKYERPEVFKEIKFALHLPQYLSSIISNRAYSEITSIGCHTNLWDFSKGKYHEWVIKEGVLSKLPSILPSGRCNIVGFNGKPVRVGIGLHDSSAALIPYLLNFNDPFILLSTGTWCISLNPFNDTPLTNEELKQDCLTYITFNGKPVKASRLFAGYEHEQQTKSLIEKFNLPSEHFSTLKFNDMTSKKWAHFLQHGTHEAQFSMEYHLTNKDIPYFEESEEPYHELIIDIVTKQFIATKLVQRGTGIKRLFVDGGFSRNNIYMNLITAIFPDMKIYAASVAEASALGAALAIHSEWNENTVSSDLVDLKYYADETKEL